MSFRPAGYSSDEDDELENFSFGEDIKSEKERREEIVTELYRKRVESENTSKHRFYSAIIKGDVDKIKQEIKSGFNVNSEVSSDWTSLFLAVTQNKPLIVEELLKNGVDLKVNRDGCTPLMAACSCPKNTVHVEDSLNIVNLLIKYGVDVKARDRKRRNAFMLACAQGFIEVVKLLLPLSNLEETDNQGWTALFFCVQENNYDIVKILIDHGVNVKHIDVRNNDFQYYAKLNGCDTILNLLPKNDFEIYPDDFTNESYNYESVFELLKNGERPNFKSDIYCLLYGMKCQNLIPVFDETNIVLKQFLILNERDLEELGISMTFQRDRILQGLFKFHRHSWKKKSVPYISINEIFTNHEIFVTMINTMKHLTTLEATMKYLQQNLNASVLNLEKDVISTKTMMVHKKIYQMKCAVHLLHTEAHKLDTFCQGPADFITAKRNFRKNLLFKKISIGIAGLSIIFIFIKLRMFKK